MSVEHEELGNGAWRWPLPEGIDRAGVLETLRTWPGIDDVVLSEQYACVLFDPRRPPDAPWETLRRLSPPAEADARTIRIRVRYHGEDLEAVAQRTGLDVPSLIAVHTAPTYQVSAIGFLPGFAYLRGLDPRLHLPRRAEPRPRVPPRSVAIAAGYTGIYPLATPGGWHLLGSAVEFDAFTPERGAVWQVGDRVRFQAER